MGAEIQTYWNVEVLYQFFNAVTSLMAGQGFKSAAKFLFYVALLFGVFSWVEGKHHQWFVNTLIGLFFFMVLTVAKTNVAIVDKTGLEPPKVVSNVPTVLAWTVKSTNTLFTWMTLRYESLMSIPDELSLAKGDLAFGHRILKQVGRATIADPGLRSDLMHFFKECTIYDIKDGAITSDEVLKQGNTWDTIFSKTSPARFVSYNTLSSSPQTDSCLAVATTVSDNLSTRVKAAADAAQTFYGKQAFTRASSDAIAQSMYIAAVGKSYDWILAASADSSAALRQGMFNTLWREAGSELPAMLNDPARIQEVNSLTSSAAAARAADGSNSSISLLAQESLPHMRNWIEAILIGIFPFVVLMMVVVSNEARKPIFKGYVSALAWIGLWPVMFAMINQLSLVLLQKKAAAMGLSAGVPFQLSDAFDATLQDELTMVGYMVASVPFISGAIIKLASGQVMGLADRLFSSTMSAGSSMGGEMAKGNFSAGSTSMDSFGANHTAMNKFDRQLTMASGGFSVQTAGGGTMVGAPNGRLAMQQLSNRLLRSGVLSRSSSSGLQQEGGMSSNASFGDSLSLRSGKSAQLASVKGTGRTRGNDQATDSNVGIQEGGSTSRTSNKDAGFQTSDSRQSTYSLSAGAADSFGGRIGAQASIGAAGSDGASNSSAASGTTRDQKRLAKTMASQGASQEAIDQAVSNLRNSAQNSTTSPGNSTSQRNGSRGIGSLGASFSASSQKTYRAEQGRNYNSGETTSGSETSAESHGYNVTATQGLSTKLGSSSTQTNRDGADATLTRYQDRSRSTDSSFRQDINHGQKASQSDSLSFSINQDMLADPDYLSKVANRFGMSDLRFMTQAEGEQWAMIEQYAAEKTMATQHMPTNLPGGMATPSSTQQVNQSKAANDGKIADNIERTHSKNVSATGYSGTQPVTTTLDRPELINATKNIVDPASLGAKPGARPADEAGIKTRDFTSGDRNVGAGRAMPLGDVEKMIGDDLQDTASKAIKKLRGDENWR
jgi:conjugal transfer mating pair stabilization protein TraG